MFVDSVTLEVSSGKGGSGCSSFRREKFVVKGGPDGGDGGKGGNVYFEVTSNSDTLSFYNHKNKLKASNGADGKSRNMTGKSGEDLILRVPVGTVVIDNETNEILFDLVDDEAKTLLLKGGKGGLGNVHFKSSTNQRPTYSQNGLPGEKKSIRLELKLIANIGLVGFPNVGKSTLISTISNCKSLIGNYEFTTLTPKLGVVNINEFDSFVIADIPGIIENASLGKGLGIKFLKHIQRAQTLLLMLDISSQIPIVDQFNKLKKELNNFSQDLASKNFAIILTKCDTVLDDILKDNIINLIDDFGVKPSLNNNFNFDKSLPYYVQDIDSENLDSKLPIFILPISCVTIKNLDSLKYILYKVSNL